MERKTTYTKAITAVTYSKRSTIDFSAIQEAYSDPLFTDAFNEIFACINQYLFWAHVQLMQSLGVTDDTVGWISQHKNAYCEKATYVANRIQSNLGKVIRCCCHLNSDINRYGGRRFLTCKFEKTDEGMFSLRDAERLAIDIAETYEAAVGKSLMETRWDMR